MENSEGYRGKSAGYFAVETGSADIKPFSIFFFIKIFELQQTWIYVMHMCTYG